MYMFMYEPKDIYLRPWNLIQMNLLVYKKEQPKKRVFQNSPRFSFLIEDSDQNAELQKGPHFTQNKQL